MCNANHLAQYVRNALLLGNTAWNHLADDPLLLLVQSARRLPESARERCAQALAWKVNDDSVRRALALFVADRYPEAREVLAASTPANDLARRLAAELAIQIGLDPERFLDSLRDVSAGASTRARLAWSQGDVRGAVRAVEGVSRSRRQYARLRSEWAVMAPGFRLPAPEPSPAWTPPEATGQTRVLHVLTNSLPRTQSGYAVRSHAVLRAQREAGLRVRAVTRIGYPVTVGLANATALDAVDGIEYRRLLPARLAPTPAARLVQMMRMLAREVEQFRPHVLHTTTNFQNALVTQAVAQAYGLPWVYEMRGVLELTWVASRPEAEREAAAQSQRYQLLRAKETEMAQAANAVVVLSEVQKADLVDRGVSADKIYVVPNAVEDEVLTRAASGNLRSPAEARERVGLPREGTWVGSVSSVVAYEGFEVLLGAVARCRERGADIHCLIVGSGVSLPALRQRAEQLGLGEDVCVLPGRKPTQEALSWYGALDVFCVPRLDTPVCRMVTPIKPLTAMALGRPVIVSDLPALTEVTCFGRTTAVPAGDVGAWTAALMRLTTNESEHHRPSAPLPTWSTNGRTYAEIYEVLR